MKLGDKVYYLAINVDGTWRMDNGKIVAKLTSETEGGKEAVYEVVNETKQGGRLAENRLFATKEGAIVYMEKELERIKNVQV